MTSEEPVSAIELQSSLHRLDNEALPASTSVQELDPTDGGRPAWTVLIAGVVFEALFWGKPHLTGFATQTLIYSRFPHVFRRIPELLRKAVRLHK